MSDLALRGLSAGGLFVLLGLAWIASSNRAAVDRRTVRNGMALQLVLAGVLLGTPVGKLFLVLVERPIAILIDVSQAGARFLFGVSPPHALRIATLAQQAGRPRPRRFASARKSFS